MSLSHYSSRFTLQGNRSLDSMIKQQLKRSVRYLCDLHEKGDLAAIWLGGSYGRGEGAVLNENKKQRAWGDYDLFLIYNHVKQSRFYAEKYEQWQQRFLRDSGILLDLRTPGTLKKVYKKAEHFYWHSLCKRHQKLWVSPRLTSQRNHFQKLPDRSESYAADLILYSAVTLLTEVSEQNFYRIVLAICDSLLLLTSRYTDTLQGRLQNMYRLQQELGIFWLRELFFLQQEAVRACLFPSETHLDCDVGQLKTYLKHAAIAFFVGIKERSVTDYLREDAERALMRLKEKKDTLAFWVPFLFSSELNNTHLLVGKPWSTRLPKHIYQEMKELPLQKQRQILQDYFLGAVKVFYTNDTVYRMNNI